MDAPLTAALEAVAARLRAHRIPFLLGGSGLLDALGLDVPVRDLDLMLRAADRAAFEHAAGDWLVAVTTEPGPVMRSAWKAPLDVGGEEVDGLGGLGMVLDGRTVRLPFRAQGTGPGGVPLAAPEIWWLAYRAYKPERAALLEPLVGEAARASVLAEVTGAPCR
jgi:hypothetical protein